MKVQVGMKSSDCLENAIKDHLRYNESLSNEEKEESVEMFLELCEKWFRYGEYLIVEIDTLNETIKVIGRK